MVNPRAVVAGIREATALLLEGGNLELVGNPANAMKVFHRSMSETREYLPGSDISFLMK